MGSNTAGLLLEGIERIEGIDAKIAELKETIKGYKADRKVNLEQIRTTTGFVPKVVDQMIRERGMDPYERKNFQAQVQVCRGILGMLDGTPLGEAARKAFEKKKSEEEGNRIEDPGQETLPEIPDPPAPPTEEDIEACRKEGQEAARNGAKIGDNPYPADVPAKRAAWDEGYCYERGSDGMDIPEELRRKKKKSSDDDGDGEEGN